MARHSTYKECKQGPEAAKSRAKVGGMNFVSSDFNGSGRSIICK